MSNKPDFVGVSSREVFVCLLYIPTAFVSVQFSERVFDSQ